MFGDSAIKQNRNLRLILKLVSMTEEQMHRIDRLHGAPVDGRIVHRVVRLWHASGGLGHTTAKHFKQRKKR